MGGFYQWVEDPSTNPTWGGLFGSGASEAGQNILGSSGSLSSEWWGFPGGQWGPEGFSIPWYAPMPGQDDAWWGTDLGQSLYEMIFGIPYGMGGGNVQDLPAPPADVTPALPGEETAPPTDAVTPDPSSLPEEDPGYQTGMDFPTPEEGSSLDDIMAGIIAAGGAAGAGLGATFGGGSPDPSTLPEEDPGGVTSNMGAQPTDPAYPDPATVPWNPGEGLINPGGLYTNWGIPQTVPPEAIPTISSGLPFALDPVPISSELPGTLTPGTTSGTTTSTPKPSIPDLSSSSGGSGAPYAAPPDAHAGAPKNLTSLMQLPASVVQQIPRLGALLAGLR